MRRINKPLNFLIVLGFLLSLLAIPPATWRYRPENRDDSHPQGRRSNHQPTQKGEQTISDPATIPQGGQYADANIPNRSRATSWTQKARPRYRFLERDQAYLSALEATSHDVNGLKGGTL